MAHKPANRVACFEQEANLHQAVQLFPGICMIVSRVSVFGFLPEKRQSVSPEAAGQKKTETFGIAAESPSAVYRCDRFLPGAKIHISVAGVEGRCRDVLILQ